MDEGGDGLLRGVLIFCIILISIMFTIMISLLIYDKIDDIIIHMNYKKKRKKVKSKNVD